ncbi:hypothetical protein OAU13_01025 [bacterium]|nr:hypothetical protein [bacterium]
MADNETKKTQEETRSFLKDLKDKLSKNTNKEIEDNQKKTIDKMDVFYNTVTAKLTTLNKDVTKESTLDQMLPFVIQIADNIYNIAAKMDAQVTSLKEVTKVLDARAMGPKPDEGAELEKQREGAGRKGMDQKEKKVESFWDKLGRFFEFVLIPIVAGFVIGLSKSLGLFESGIGKFITLFGVLYLAFSGFRKAVNSLVINLAKKGLELIRGRSATKAAGTVADAATGKGVPGKPGTVEGPVVKQPKGPSGLDKFLENAKKIGKSLKDLFVGIGDTIAKVLGKLAGGIKDFISKVSEGIKNLLQNIAKGIESFGKGNVLKGAAALLVVSGALFVAAKAFKEFADVKWESVAKGLVGITGLVVVMKLLEKVTGSIIKGAAALAIMSGALFIAGKAFQQFANVDWQMLAVAAVGIGGLAAALMLLGPLIVPITLGAAALGVMSLALAGFGAAVQVLAVGLPALTEFLQKISMIDGVGLISAAAGITAIGVALAALGAGQVVQAIGNFVSSILSFGEDDIFTKLTRLGEVAGNLKELPSIMQQLGQLADFEVSDKFEDGVDKLAKGIVKLAIAAKAAKALGLQLPIASDSFVKAPGQAVTQPAKAQPTKTEPAKAQPQPRVYSDDELAAQRKRLETAEKAGGKAAISNERSRLQSMESQNKQAAAATKMTPEQRTAVTEGTKVKPVPTGVPGQALNQESQKVAGATGTVNGPSQNVVAPVTTTNVNQSQTQNLSVKPSATPEFGMKYSRPAFGF